MSRTTAPLLSFGASGAIAKTQVYAEWKGRPYARRYVIPANPRTTEQQSTRNVFGWLQKALAYYPAAALAAWEMKAANNRITANNQWIKDNLAALRDETDLDNLVMSPAAGGGVSAAGFTITPGNDQVELTLAAPPLPTGWTIVQAHFAAVRDQDPHSGALFAVSYAFDASAPYTQTIGSLASAADYQVAGWFEYLTDAGKTVYGPNSRGQALTT
jgi:hypothetical protein